MCAEHDIDDLEMQVVRYKPESLDNLSLNTKFSRKELQIMYRGFKQVNLRHILLYVFTGEDSIFTIISLEFYKKCILNI